MADNLLEELRLELNILGCNIEQLHLERRYKQYEGSLDLSFLGLKDIPIKSIMKMKGLKILYLNENNIISLPKEIGKLSDLIYLNLHKNNLKEIPDNLYNLVNLRYLSLSTNLLDILSPKIGKLLKLKSLILSGNRLKTLPETISELENLQTLHIFSNLLTTIPDLYLLQELKLLSIYNNNLKDSENNKLIKLKKNGCLIHNFSG